MVNFYFIDKSYLIIKEFSSSKKKSNLIEVNVTEGELDEKYIELSKKINDLNLSLDTNDRKEYKKTVEDSRKKLLDEQNDILSKKDNIFLNLNLEFRTQEFDGFFQTRNKISIGKYISIDIQPKSFVIVECKNNEKVEEIISNIRQKKYNI